MDISFFSVLLSTTVSKLSNLRHVDNFMKAVDVTDSDAGAPTHISKEDDTSHNRLEDLQHLAEYIEGSKLH